MTLAAALNCLAPSFLKPVTESQVSSIPPNPGIAPITSKGTSNAPHIEA